MCFCQEKACGNMLSSVYSVEGSRCTVHERGAELWLREFYRGRRRVGNEVPQPVPGWPSETICYEYLHNQLEHDHQYRFMDLHLNLRVLQTKIQIWASSGLYQMPFFERNLARERIAQCTSNFQGCFIRPFSTLYANFILPVLTQGKLSMVRMNFLNEDPRTYL